jgi:hypothetical protein
LDVHQYVRALRCRSDQCLLTVLRLHYFVVRAPEEVAQNSPIILLVFDDENSLAHAGSASLDILKRQQIKRRVHSHRCLLPAAPAPPPVTPPRPPDPR